MPMSPTRKAPAGAAGSTATSTTTTATSTATAAASTGSTDLAMASQAAELNAMASAAAAAAQAAALQFEQAKAAAVVAAQAVANANLNLGINVSIDPTNINTSTTSHPSNSQLGIKRKSISLSQKKEAIEWIMGPGKGVPSRAEKHFSELNWDVSASSFRKWWKNRDKIMNDASTKKRITGGGRKPYLEDSEEKILVAVIHERAKKERVTRKWIAKTAQQMFQHTNSQFKASENWVTKFIRRNGLTLKRSYVAQEQEI